MLGGVAERLMAPVLKTGQRIFIKSAGLVAYEKSAAGRLTPVLTEKVVRITGDGGVVHCRPCQSFVRSNTTRRI